MKNLESHIKASLENYEAPYNPADWSDMENRLNNVNAGKLSTIGKGLMITASAIAVSALIYYFSNTHSDNNTAEKTIAANQTISNHEVKENSVQKVESNTQNPSRNLSGQNPDVNNNSSKEKVLATAHPSSAEEKSVAVEKTETQVENNHIENKSDNQDPETNSVPSASFHADVYKVCEGGQVQCTADNNGVACAYKWYFGDGQSSAEQNPTHIFAEAGTYSVKLRVTSVNTKKWSEQKNTITVLPAPSLRMNYAASDDNNLLLKFDADAGKVVEWKWDFGDKQTSSEQNPVHTYSKKGNYKVMVTAKNSSGCTSSVTKEMNVQPEINLFAPTGFSPNGDGINDTWMPVALLNGDYIFTLAIYDKSGTAVFTTSDKNRPWDGQNAKTGDTFSWKAMVKDKNGEELNYKGIITIAE